ncbi:MAG: DNA gyrase inhibitor YacG [Pseudomonadales bacterium]
MADKQTKFVRCPVCNTKTAWSTNNTNRPFCSERCRNKDFVAWANEENVMAGDSDYDDVLSDDLHRE